MTDNKVTKEGIARERQAADAAQAYLDANAEIDALEPGWMLDLWIIKKVPLGVQTRFCPGADKCQILRNGEWVDFAPSTDANDASEVVAAIKASSPEGLVFTISWGPDGKRAAFGYFAVAFGAEFPEAICKAALKAVRK